MRPTPIRFLLLSVVLCACTPAAPKSLQTPAPTATPSANAADPLIGAWHGALTTAGGELPFGLVISAPPTGDNSSGYQAVVTNGDERRSVAVERQGNRVTLRFEPYDATLQATLDGAKLTGTWQKTIPGGHARLPFVATRGQQPRFAPMTPAADAMPNARANIAGQWAVVFKDANRTFPAVAEFTHKQDRVLGTFLTGTGDYRYLEGTFKDGFLRLSAFDGAHAFLFHARVQASNTLVGDFWSRDSYHATWTAEPLGARTIAEVLPDPFAEVRVVSADGRLRFRFPDLDGNPVSWDDPRFRGKVVLVDIFGSWCPNCNDAALLLAHLHRRYRDRGLEVVGLAFEYTGDVERDQRVLRVFKNRYGIEFPILLAGTSDKQAASAIMTDLSGIKSYPTAIFIGRDGRVHTIHSGFAGPGTGIHYDALVEEFERIIGELLAKSAP